MGLVKVHVDSKGIIDALWRGERKCVDPKAGDTDLRIKMLEELHLFMSKEILMEVEHVKTAWRKHFEKFVTERNEKADGWQTQKHRRSARDFAVRGQLSLLNGGMEGLWRAQAEAKRKLGFRG